MGLESFDEHDLSRNLDWLHENQTTIEDRLFRVRHPDGKVPPFLYDVTSSYLEGTENELAAFGSAGGILFCPRVALETTRKNQLEPDISKWPCHTSAPGDRFALMMYQATAGKTGAARRPLLERC